MTDEEHYKYLEPGVVIRHCNRETPMDIDGNDAVKLKQLWIHDEVEEINPELDGRYMFLYCPVCKYRYSVDLGD